MIGSGDAVVIAGVLGTISIAIIKMVPRKESNVSESNTEDIVELKVNNGKIEIKMDNMKEDITELKEDMKEVKINTSSIPLLITELKAQGKR